MIDAVQRVPIGVSAVINETVRSSILIGAVRYSRLYRTNIPCPTQVGSSCVMNIAAEALGVLRKMGLGRYGRDQRVFGANSTCFVYLYPSHQTNPAIRCNYVVVI